ncbi:MAG: NADPH-dependent FMN reductase [Candidatus Doudnabacteria bacterium]
MLNVKVILGSTRPGRFSEKLIPWIQESLSEQKDIQFEVLDLKDFDLPIFNLAFSPAYMTGNDYGNEIINKWSVKINEADAYIVVSPEYNHGYSSVLKNAMDLIFKEWNNKPVAFISYGSVGGARAVEQLRLVSAELHMASVRTGVHIFAPWLLQDESGKLKDGVLAQYTPALKTMLSELQLWGKAFQSTRNK